MTPRSSQHSLLATLVLPVAQVLRRDGIDPMEVLAEVGIDMAKAADPDWRVPLARFGPLLERCVELSGDEAFGLAAAERLQPQVLHGLGLAWLASDTVYDGLRRVARFARFVSTGSRVRLEEEGEFVHAVLIDAGPLRPVIGPIQDYGVGVLVRMCQLNLGEYLAPSRVQLQRKRPTNPDRWEYMLSSRVEFDCPRACISWPLSEIQEPLVTGDPALARVNDEQTQAYLNTLLDSSTARIVADHIVQALPDGPPDQSQIASLMNVSSRTLQRKLREEGMSFTELLQETRLNLAQRYLAEQNRSVVESAYLLGFSEPSTFSRAFKRWTGVAPADYRSGAGR